VEIVHRGENIIAGATRSGFFWLIWLGSVTVLQCLVWGRLRLRRGLMKRILIGTAALVLSVAISGPASAQRVKAGTLDCDVSGGWGWIIGSVRGSRAYSRLTGRARSNTTADPSANSGSTSAPPAANQWCGRYLPTHTGGAVRWPATTRVQAARQPSSLGSAPMSSSAVPIEPSRCSRFSLTGQAGLNLAIGVADLQLYPGR